MNTNFDDLWEQTASDQPEEKRRSSFDDLWEQTEEKPKKSKLEKAGRVAGQYALGAAENAMLPYELSVIPLASKEAQNIPYREGLGEELDQLMHQKSSGHWTDQDEEFLKHIEEQIKDPRKSMEFAQTANVGIRDIAEKVTGEDLHPEGFLEKAANWEGFIKNPKKLASLAKSGGNLKDLVKAIAPSKTESMRGLGAGIGLQMAEDGNFGPIGTIAAAVVGDLAGGGIARAAKKVVKEGLKFAKNPKKYLANKAAKLVPKEKLDLQKSIIKDFQEAGIQADIGTITNSNLIKSMQTKLSQSSLTGTALEDLKKTMTEEIKDQYKKLANSLGEARFQTSHEAGQVGKEYLTTIRNAEKERIGDLYSKARDRINIAGEQAVVNPSQLHHVIESLEKSLKPGAVKSTEQKAVLEILEKIKGDVLDTKGQLKNAKVKDLMNNKTALNEIINYEVQGGQKKLLGNLVSELDEAIKTYGHKDKEFLKNYATANKEFAEHAKTFRNNNINKILMSEDPQVLMNKMNSVQGIKDIERALGKSPVGKKTFGQLKRFKLDQMIGDKMVDNASQQLKTGTFSNLLKNPKDFQIAKEILGEQAVKQIVKLQKVVGHIHESAYKFFNASKTASTAVDSALIFKGMNDLANALSGNPWPLLKTSSAIFGARYVSNLMADTKFLKYVEEAVLSSNRNDISGLLKLGPKLEESIRAAMAEESLRQEKD